MWVLRLMRDFPDTLPAVSPVHPVSVTTLVVTPATGYGAGAVYLLHCAPIPR